MKLLTRDTDYAVRALCAIAKGKKILSVTDLVGEIKIPRPFLRKIMQVLAKEKIVSSRRGVGGGFVLGRPASRIFVVDLMRAFQGSLKLNECIFKKRVCPGRASCPLKVRLDIIEENVMNDLGKITIASLL